MIHWSVVSRCKAFKPGLVFWISDFFPPASLIKTRSHRHRPPPLLHTYYHHHHPRIIVAALSIRHRVIAELIDAIGYRISYHSYLGPFFGGAFRQRITLPPTAASARIPLHTAPLHHQPTSSFFTTTTTTTHTLRTAVFLLLSATLHISAI
jgi:hypothetical protein